MRLFKRKLKKTDPSGKLELEKVIGLTTLNANGLSYNHLTNDIAYLAGYVVVIYNTQKDLQTRFLMVSRAPKTLISVVYSPEGKFIAAGESGHQPSVIVWDALTGSSISDLKAHKNGVSCLQFSPNERHLISIGVPYDGFLCLWDWKAGALVTKIRVTVPAVPVHSVHFSSDGNFLITAGVKHLKQWTIGGQSYRNRSSKGHSLIETVSLEGKPINLGSQKDSSFKVVSCAAIGKVRKEGENQTDGLSPFYVLTSSGVLCLLHGGIAVEKWVDLKVKHGYGLSVSETQVACACSDGIVRVFFVKSLAYSGTLPRPAPHGYHGLTDAKFSSALAMGSVQGVQFPDAVACTFLVEGNNLAVIYDDHSLYIWDIRNMSKIGRYQTFLSHSSCIWDIATIPMDLQSQAIVDMDNLFQKNLFATCSADRSIRIWNLDSGHKSPICNSDIVINTSQNVYCRDLVGVLYMEKSEHKDPLCNGFEKESADSANSFRAVCVSPDGHLLAAGDRNGNVHVYDLMSLKLLSFKEAHDAEILSLDFGASSGTRKDLSMHGGSSFSLLASGGRDRLIHLYDANRDFEVIETLDDHSASVTKLKFAGDCSKLLSCSADRSIVFRHIIATESGCRSARFHQEMATRGTIYDIDVDSNNKLVVSVGQDKKVNILNLETGKPLRHMKSEGEFGEPIKVRIDPSGTFVVCSYSDKYLRIYDVSNGELLLQASGHAEIITGLAFLPDCKHLVSVSGDSCIFVWKLPPMMSRIMRKKVLAKLESQPTRTLKSILEESDDANCYVLISPKLQTLTAQTNAHVIQKPDRKVSLSKQKVLPATTGASGKDPSPFKFSVSKLPTWAQAKIDWNKSAATMKKLDDHVSYSSKSQWTERLGNEGYKLFTESIQEVTPPPTVNPSEFGVRRRFSIEASAITLDSTPESSMNSKEEGNGLLSPKQLSRDAEWKTVHTVFFDEMDFSPDNCVFEDKGLTNFMASKNSLECRSLEASVFARVQQLHMHQENRENGLMLECVPEGRSKSSEDENNVSRFGHFKEGEGVGITSLLKDLPISCQQEGWETITSKFRHSNSDVSPKDNSGSLHLSPDWPSRVLEEGVKNGCSLFESSHISAYQSCDEETCEDDDFSPRRDLFSTHFDKLSTVLKVNNGPTSARSSFSTRFFARASLPFSQVMLFKNSPPKTSATEGLSLDNLIEENQRDCSLSEERERLKLQERQEKMSVEVQRVRQRLVNLGMVVQEGGSSESKKHLGDSRRVNSYQTSVYHNLVCNHELSIQRSPCTATLSDEQGAMLIPEASAPSSISAVEELRNSNGDLANSPFEENSFKQSSKVDDVELFVLNGKDICVGDDVSELTPQHDEVMKDVDLPEMHMSDMCEIDENLLFQPGESSSIHGTARNYTITHSVAETKSSMDIPRSHELPSPIGGIYTNNSGSQKLPSSLVHLPRPKEDYTIALDVFKNAAEKIMLFFCELQYASNDTSVCSSSEILELTRSYQEHLLAMVQKVQVVMDRVVTESPCDASDRFSTRPGNMICQENIYVDTGSETGPSHFLSRPPAPCTSRCDSLRSSVNVEDLLERYSVRFSETLASQVLALVLKGLDSDSKTVNLNK